MRKSLSRRQFAATVSAAAIAAAAAGGSAWAAEESLADIIAGPQRSPANVARDRYRRPAQALAFFGLRDDLSVLEIDPGGGYWTEILAPYLKARGQYRAAIPPPPVNSARELAARAGFLAKLRDNQACYGRVQVSVFSDNAPLAAPDSIDLILSFRNLHDWMANGTAAEKLAAIYAALKPGGVFGIEDHRGLATQLQDPRAKSGYVREDYAIALIEHAGFKLAGESPIGDNPRDTKTYPKGVWTLPPVLAMGETDRAKYLAIGESDRWTLKFIKPDPQG